jgi:hypothetical protein
MRAFHAKTQQHDTRWIILFGLLAGLFFSGGEGIQLMPFRIAKAGNSKNTSLLRGNNSKSYALSVHNSNKYSPLLKFKSHKDSKQHSASGHLTFNGLNASANYYLQSVCSRNEAEFLHIILLLDSQSERGPPVL